MVRVIKTSNVLNVLLSMNIPAWFKSTTPISEIIPVVKNKKINWLLIEGKTLLTAKGKIIL